jgi:CBS domain-containing protein
LSAEAVETFCEDISGMFGVEIRSEQSGSGGSAATTVGDLKTQFKKLCAVFGVKAQGALNGTFYLVFDKDGMFTLAGTIVTQSEQKITENRRQGSEKEAENVTDAIREVGNLLVGAWNRVFREDLDGHKHFVQTSTFIGNPWDNPEKDIGLGASEELDFIPFEMTVGSYPPFHCGAILPKSVFDGKAQTGPDVGQQQTDAKDESAKQMPASPEGDKAVEHAAAQAEAPTALESAPAGKDTSGRPGPENEQAGVQEAADDAKAQEDATAVASTTVIDQAPAAGVAEPGPISEAIQRMTQSAAAPPGESTCGGAAPHQLVADEGGDRREDRSPMSGPIGAGSTSAKDIMCRQVVWSTGDETVEQAQAKMSTSGGPHGRIGYMLIGTNGVPEGILSRSDIAGAISPYLRPAFSKWRRPLDDATLQIRAKWIMSRPVRTIIPETPLATIMAKMRQFGCRCLPVVEQQGKVVGLVTVFEVFGALLGQGTNPVSQGATPKSAARA